MKALQGYSNKKPFFAILLTLGLLLGSVFFSYIISAQDVKIAAVIVMGIIGVGVALLSFIRPAFGFYASIALSFILFYVQRIIVTGGFGFLVEILMYISFIGILFHRYVRKDPAWALESNWDIISVLMIVYLVYVIMESLNPATHSMEGNLVYIREVAKQVVGYFIALSLFKSFKNIKYFLFVWGLLMFLCALYGCYQQWHGLSKIELKWIAFSDTYIKLYKLDNGDFRKFSTLTDPMSFGVLSAVSALLILPMIISEKLMRLKGAYFFVMLIMLLGMSYSGTRTATFAFVIGIVLYTLLTINNKRTLVFAGSMGMIFCILMFGPFYGNVTINRFRSTFNSEDASYNARNTNRNMVQPYIHGHPFGGGLSTTGGAGATYNPGHPIAAFPPDSGLLKFALELGWFGLILMCATYFAIIRRGVHSYFRMEDPERKKYMLAMVLATFAFVVTQYSQVAIGQIPGSFLFYGLAAGIARLSQIEKLTPKHKQET